MPHFRPGEEFDAWQQRGVACDFDVSNPDELKDFFGMLPGRLRDALTSAARWDNPPAINHPFWRGFVARRQWWDRAIAILLPLAHRTETPTQPFRWLQRMIHGGVPRDRAKAHEAVDALRDLHLALFGTDGEYVTVWEIEAAEVEQSPVADKNAGALNAALAPPSYSAAQIIAELGCSERSFTRYRHAAGVAAKRRGGSFNPAERIKILRVAAMSSDSTCAANAQRALVSAQPAS